MSEAIEWVVQQVKAMGNYYEWIRVAETTPSAIRDDPICDAMEPASTTVEARSNGSVPSLAG